MAAKHRRTPERVRVRARVLRWANEGIAEQEDAVGDRFGELAAEPGDDELAAAAHRPPAAALLLVPAGALALVYDRVLAAGGRRGAAVEGRLVAADLSGPAQDILLRTPVPERAADWMRVHGAARVREVEEATRQAIQRIVAARLDQGVHVRSVARELRGVVGVHPRNVAPILRYEATLKEAGMPAAKVEQRVARRWRQAVRARAELIARSETVQAMEAGRRSLYEELDRRGHIEGRRMVRIWLSSTDERTCPICEGLEGTEADGLDASFPGGYSGPGDPHPSCRCTTVYEEREARAAA